MSQPDAFLTIPTTHEPSSPNFTQPIISILGAQWGDEGKGKLVDILAAKTDVCCRFNGGANAGHTLVVDGVKYALHLAPCGVLYPHTKNFLGNGMELEEVEMRVPDARQRVFLSSRAHLLFDLHLKADSCQEDKKVKEGSAIGTTRRGIGPCYATKMARSGLRVCDLLNWETFQKKYKSLALTMQAQYGFEHDLDEEIARHAKYRDIFMPQIVDGVSWIHEKIHSGQRILIEGANATMLDIDFGTYPFVTSSSTTVGGILTGLGIPPSLLGDIFGVVKAYTTRVGEGPFPTELFDTIGEHLRKIGCEYGTTTGRPRRCGWLDIVLLRYSVAICGFTKLNLTKLDVLTGLPELCVCVAYKNKTTGELLPPLSLPASMEEYVDIEPVYETLPGWTENLSAFKSFAEFPEAARNYVHHIEELLGCVVAWVGIGCGREDMITRM